MDIRIHGKPANLGKFRDKIELFDHSSPFVGDLQLSAEKLQHFASPSLTYSTHDADVLDC